FLALIAAGGPIVEPGAAPPSSAVPPQAADMGFDQKPGSYVPLDLSFRNEAGNRVRLGDLIDAKPTILVLAYYRCPQLCTLVLNGLFDGLREVGFGPKEFNVITVSFDPREPPE